MSGGPPRGILCVGRVYCDLIFSDLPRLPTMGTEVFAGGLSLHPGGGAFITAAWAAALGRPAALAGWLPAAPFGPAMAADLGEAGVDLALCRPAETDAPQITVALTGPEDRAFVTRRTGTAAPPVTARDLAGRGLTHLHVGELTTLIEMPELIGAARAAGLTVSLDCAWDDATEAAVAAPLIAQVDVFLPNAEEAARLGSLGIAEGATPLTVIKRGAEGSEARGRCVPAARCAVVDTTGAGDAFNAGFLDAWLDGRPIEACLAAGNAAGVRAIGVRGGYAPRPSVPAM
ncbi:carbohydrate kinase [Rhodobacteraceae bacterium CCMM004]|nr:carbohydrate kinase [Rhodobacteraceae bacterium CCMM004]